MSSGFRIVLLSLSITSFYFVSCPCTCPARTRYCPSRNAFIPCRWPNMLPIRTVSVGICTGLGPTSEALTLALLCLVLCRPRPSRYRIRPGCQTQTIQSGEIRRRTDLSVSLTWKWQRKKHRGRCNECKSLQQKEMHFYKFRNFYCR